jgi:hypothetical protein
VPKVVPSNSFSSTEVSWETKYLAVLTVVSTECPLENKYLAVGLSVKVSAHGSHYLTAEETFGSRVVHIFISGGFC